LRNVALALPELDAAARRELIRRTFRTLGEHLGETVAMLGRGERPAPLDVSAARATLEEARSEGTGVLFASAHLGPWENVAASLVAGGLPLVALARESYDPRFSAVLDELRRASGVPVVWRSRADAAIRMVRALRRGEVLGIPMDLRSRVPSIDAPFLGRLARTPLGPARLALRTGVPVVVGTVAPDRSPRSVSTKTGAGLVVTATRIRTDDLDADDEGTATLTGRINDELSRRIRAIPHAWVWMHERW
jgi:KDO2-lipid IV(A) lauroyltransferase